MRSKRQVLSKKRKTSTNHRHKRNLLGPSKILSSLIGGEGSENILGDYIIEETRDK